MYAQTARALLLLCSVLAFLAGGYWWGHTASDNAWQVKQAKADQKVRAQLDAMTASAGRAALRYWDEHLAQKDRYATLDHEYRALRDRHPLVVPGPVTVVACHPKPAPKPVAQPAPDPAVDSGPVLTLAAVRMWNGALTGVDSPAGACGAAGAAEGADAACSESAGLTLGDVWDNHATNARSCAEDRQRYRALINLLNQTKGE